MLSQTILRIRFVGLTLAVGLVVWAATSLAFFSWGVLGGYPAQQITGPLSLSILMISIPPVLLAPLSGFVAQSAFRKQLLFTLTLIMFCLVLLAYSANGSIPWLSISALLWLFAIQYLMIAHVVLTELKFELRILQIGYLSTFVVTIAAIGFIGGIMFVFSWVNFADPLSALKLMMAALLVSVTLLPTNLPAQVLVSETLSKSLLVGSKILWKERYTRYPLLMVFVVAFLITITAAWILRAVNIPSIVPGPQITPEQVSEIVWGRFSQFAIGLFVGWLIGLTNPNAYRIGYHFPFAALLALIASIWMLFSDSRETPALLLGIAFGSIVAPLWNWVSNWTTPGWNGIAAMWLFGGAMLGVAMGGIVGLTGSLLIDIEKTCIYLLVAGTAAMTVCGWLRFARPMVEGTLEMLLRPMYHVHRHGPGRYKLPVRREPVIYIANHAAWFDPLWLSKSVPAPCTPMMTSTFYDLPVISFLMRQIIGTIRVPDIAYKKEAPEIQEAIDELDRGNAVLIFPEGYLRRKEGLEMKRFGRGIWQILTERPNTPVIACWIEGNWGSFFSHRFGPPMKKKKFDLFRRIDIGIRDPIIVPKEILADQMKTRLYLMHELSMAKATINGLKPAALPGVGDGGDE